MVEKSLITRTEREIYLGYERERRLQMLRTLTPAFMAICAIVAAVLVLALLALPVPPTAREGLLVTAAMLAACIVALGLGLLAIRGERLNLATALVAGTSALGTTGSLAIWSAYLGLDPFAMIELTPFSVVIVLAGLLGNVWWIIASTVVMNAATAVLLMFAPQAIGLHAVFGRELPLIIPVALVHQWLFAVLMITIWLLFRRTVSAVGVAYERAKQLDALKDEFISSVNHELRTPLMTMQTYLETLREQPEQLPPDQLAAALDQMCKVGDSLVELVQSILSTRRIDQEGLAFTPEAIAVRQALDAAIGLVDPRMALNITRDLHIEVPETLAVRGERVRLQQILTNLLTNAVKYSAPGTPIEVAACLTREPVDMGHAGRVGHGRLRRSAAQEAALVEITVRDYGHGIPPDQIPLLFNRFVRLPRDLASKVTGTGLGLYLCRVLTESMGGHIWVESTGITGEGSTFHLTLPAATLLIESSYSAPRLSTPTA